MLADKQKFFKKHWHKINGKIAKLDFEQYGAVLVLSKGTGDRKRLIAFKIDRYDSSMLEKAKTFSIKNRVKIKFAIKSVEYKGRWYTDLLIKELEVWHKNEKQLQRQNKVQELFDDSEYTKSFINIKL